jgi:hypothetical protein
MQDLNIWRAMRARAPLYPAQTAKPPPRRDVRLKPAPSVLSREMLRDIVIEQIG